MTDDNNTPLGDMISGAQQLLGNGKLELAEPPAEDEPGTEPEQEVGFAFANQGQMDTFNRLAILAQSHGELFGILAAELYHNSRHPNDEMSTTVNQLNRRIDAIRALERDPLRLPEWQKLQARTQNMIMTVLACVSQMTHLPPPAIQVAQKMPEG